MTKIIHRGSYPAHENSVPNFVAANKLVHASQSAGSEDRIDVWFEVETEMEFLPEDHWQMLVVPAYQEIPDDWVHMESVTMRNGQAWHIYRKEVETPEKEKRLGYEVVIYSLDPHAPFIESKASFDGVMALVLNVMGLPVGSTSEFETALTRDGKVTYKDQTPNYGLCQMTVKTVA